MKKYLAFDIGGSAIKWAILNHQAQIIKKGSIIRQDTFELMIAKMVDLYQSNQDINGITISAPGSVDNQSGIIGGMSALDYIHGPNFKEIFKAQTGFDIAIENDANCAALSEAYFGDENNLQDIAYVVLGSGIGGALIKNRQLHYGANRSGGEFGYMLMNNKLENWSELGSTVNLVKRVQKVMNNPILTGEEVFELAKTNHEIEQIVDEFYSINARGLYNIQYVYDPQIIYLGGGITANKLVCSNLKKRLNQVCQQSIGKVDIKVQVGKYGADANLVGALANLLYIEQN